MRFKAFLLALVSLVVFGTMAAGCAATHQGNATENPPILSNPTQAFTPTTAPSATAPAPTETPPPTATATQRALADGITFEQGYPLALDAAQEQHTGAALYMARPAADNPFTLQVGPDGSAPRWEYFFYNAAAPDKEGARNGWLVAVGPVGVERVEPDELNLMYDLELYGEAESWTITVAEALAIAEANGGETYRQKYPGAIVMPLLHINPPSQDENGPAPHWAVGYATLSNLRDLMELVIDAASGEYIPSASRLPGFMTGVEETPVPGANLLELQDSDKPPITAKEAFARAGEAAHEWHPQAQLASMRYGTVDILSLSNGLPPDGKLSVWGLYFQAPEGETGKDGEAAIWLKVSRAGVETTRPTERLELRGRYENWMVDSDQAVRICDAAGGAELREGFPRIYVDVELMLYEPFDAPNADSPVLWKLVYSDSHSNTQRTCWMDGVNGELIAFN